jgi:hypothetical protein
MLGDIVEDAGCTKVAILAARCQPGDQVSRSWAFDLLLEEEEVT